MLSIKHDYIHAIYVQTLFHRVITIYEGNQDTIKTIHQKMQLSLKKFTGASHQQVEQHKINLKAIIFNMNDSCMMILSKR